MGHVRLPDYDIYLFDMDGTLLDSGPTWIGIFRDCLADFGITGLSDKAIAECTHDWKAFAPHGITEELLPAFIAAATQRAAERLPLAPLYPGTAVMLETLQRAGKRLAIFTTGDRPILEPIVAHHQFQKCFEAIVAGTDVPHRKPHPAGIHEALQQLGVPQPEPGTAVYIGDKATDIQCGQNAGIDQILFFPPSHHLMYDEAELKATNPTYIISDWQELTA